MIRKKEKAQNATKSPETARIRPSFRNNVPDLALGLQQKVVFEKLAEPPNQEDAQSMQALESRCKRWPPDIKVPHSRGGYLMLADPPSQSPGRWKQSSTLMTMFPNPPCRPDPHQRQNAANPNQSRRIHLRQRRAFLLPTRRPCWRATLNATWSAARAWRRVVTAGAATSTI